MASKLAAAERDFPIGTKVKFFPVKGRPDFELSEVQSEPWALGHGDIVLKIAGRSGGISVRHLEKT